MRCLSRVLLPALAMLALAAGVAYATIPDGQGMIHACYDTKSGQLRIYEPGSEALKACDKGEAAIEWGQTGPPGAQGEPGNLALAKQACAEGSFLSGFDAAGNIVCGEATTPPPPPGPPPPPIDCDDGDPNTVDTYDLVSGTCKHTPIAP